MIGFSVEIGRIDAALTELWREIAESFDKDSRGVFRARTLNLIVYLQTGPETIEPISNEIAAFAERYPGRVIFLMDGQRRANEPLEARIAISCRASGRGKGQICAEQILLNVRGEQLGELRSLVTPLLSPDLPVFLLWLGDLVSIDGLFRSLTQTADRAIVDSSSFKRPEAELFRLAALATARRRLVLGDLAWDRLGIWRQLTADLFDSAPDLLGSIERIRITATRRPHRHAAMLYLGWLSTRLGWRPSATLDKSGPGKLSFVGPEGRDLAVEIEEGKSGEPARAEGISAVRFFGAESGGGGVQFEIFVEGSGLRCRSTLPGGRSVDRLHEPTPTNGLRLLSKQVDRIDRDPDFEQALTVAGSLLGAETPGDI